MDTETSLLEEKERKLADYLESSTTEDVLIEVAHRFPSTCKQWSVFQKLNEIKLPNPVKNTLIFYTLVTSKKSITLKKILDLAGLCKKYNIKTAQSAITFFKQYYSFHTKISQNV
jgi:replication initiation and membrane attachment protein DnaB